MSNSIPHIAILMSTYNGERYVQEQINSILGQVNVSVQLYIRDDGSTDRTSKILKELELSYDNVHLSFGENVGVGNSFMSLVYNGNISADYYAFSDQDDIWLENKLISAIREIKATDYDGPILYAGNQTIVDEDGAVIKQRYDKPRDYDYHRIVNGNPLSGCTMVWNSDLMNIVRLPNKRPSSKFFKRQLHDVWLALIASLTGRIIFDMKSYILYRQHKKNVVGAYGETKTAVLRAQIKKILHKELRGLRSERSGAVCEYYCEYIQGEYTDLYIYANYKKSLRSRMNLMREKRIREHSKESNIGFLIKVVFGFF